MTRAPAPPTAIQVATLATIERLSRHHRCPPTHRELAAVFSISYHAVLERLRALRKKALVSWDAGSARTLRVTERGHRYVTGDDSANLIGALTCDCGATHFGPACPMCAFGVGEAAQ